MQGYWDALRVQATPGAPPWLCVQTPSNPGPLPKASSFAACSTRPRRGRVLLAGVSAPHEAVQVWRSLQIVWLVRPFRRGWHAQSPQNDLSCPREIHNPGKRRRRDVAQQFKLHPSGRRVYLSFVEQADEMYGRANDQRYGKERLQPGAPSISLV